MPVQRKDIAWIFESYERHGGESDHFLLIGGGAGTHWYFALSDEGDDAEEPAQLQTRDIDFHVRGNNTLGVVRERIELLARSIGAQATCPRLGEPTPEYARLIIPGHFETGEDLEIDLLKSPHGLSVEEIEQHAERLYFDSEEESPETTYPVLHPVHVVLGLCMSYLELPSKRDAVTLQRIEALLPIVRKYLSAQAQYAETPWLGEDERKQIQKEALWGIRKLMKESARPDFATLYLVQDVDLTQAVPTKEEAPLDPKFWGLEFPSLEEVVERRRQAACNRRACNRPSRHQ